ncbi:hypothetical protein A3D03_01130 [Candidatus Gottesmanbacteria bacterium RIFCSPHIGHO2_02_FULL_40_13]|uniref:HD domain-containing protein n=1 Tax=Candidatus Gottesmanbacteria bacterium RIFCSPHIGHO2_02_FULL_40_13 TaxID=1798384 RepID=A0A1F6A6H9_9BACT|nr:MAG: hypothetical protein A3D03_01130 [Candidatus Gottesmanbacteria bacterium RIFCSPHIGHO2_02_FULL_40_13]
MITRQQALELLHSHMKSENLRRHCYSVEIVMTALAKHFKSDEAKWGIVGLLHDGDYEECKDNPTQHTLLMSKWLEDLGETDKELLDAILSHNFAHLDRRSLGEGGVGTHPPQNNLEWSLYCCDELTGLIVAVALVKGKSLNNVTVASILKKFPEKHFAAGVDREQIGKCEEKLGIKLADFVVIALTSMQSISKELGL